VGTGKGPFEVRKPCGCSKGTAEIVHFSCGEWGEVCCLSYSHNNMPSCCWNSRTLILIVGFCMRTVLLWYIFRITSVASGWMGNSLQLIFTSKKLVYRLVGYLRTGLILYYLSFRQAKWEWMASVSVLQQLFLCWTHCCTPSVGNRRLFFSTSHLDRQSESGWQVSVCSSNSFSVGQHCCTPLVGNLCS